MPTLTLSTPLSAVLRTTRDHLEALRDMGITTVEQFILYLPRGHEDLTTMQTLTSAPLDTKVTIRGILSQLKMVDAPLATLPQALTQPGPEDLKTIMAELM